MRFYRNVSARIMQPGHKCNMQAGESECVAYSYSYCSLVEEANDPPVKWEQDCYELCYSLEEKRTLPVFQKLK